VQFAHELTTGGIGGNAWGGKYVYTENKRRKIIS